MSFRSWIISALIGGILLLAAPATAGPRFSAAAIGGIESGGGDRTGSGGWMKLGVDVVPEINLALEAGYFALGVPQTGGVRPTSPASPTVRNLAIGFLGGSVELRGRGKPTTPFLAWGGGLYDRMQTSHGFPASLVDAEARTYQLGMSVGAGIEGRGPFTPIIEFRVEALMGDRKPNGFFTAGIGFRFH